MERSHYQWYDPSSHGHSYLWTLCSHVFKSQKARGSSFQEFLAQWNSSNLALNDQRFAQSLKGIIKKELHASELSCKQANVSRDTFFYFYGQ